jgi:membrane protease YdiL (CAAX protease family)
METLNNLTLDDSITIKDNESGVLPIFNQACQVVAEVVKVIAARLFLVFLGKRFLNEASKVTPHQVYLITVFGPVIEEIVFRGFLLQGIHMVQKGWHYIRHDTPSNEDEKTEQKIRIHLSTFVFAALHLTNLHKSAAGALIQFTWSYFGGVAYGYLSEKYQTLSVSILAHGFNNSLAIAAQIYPPQFTPVFFLALIANKLGTYILATSTIDRDIVTRVHQAITFLGNLPERFMNSNGQASPRQVV